MNVDLHCHLDLYPDPYKVAEECERRGTYVLSVTTTPSAWSGTCKLARNNKRIRTALGLHPHLAHQRSKELEIFDELLPNTKYVGEIGLDGGKNFRIHRDVQLRVFRHILRSVNRVGGKIMSIHTRHSAAEVMDELKDINGIFILHWFSGTSNQLKRAIEIGCWFSVNPAMMNSKKGNELVSMMPMDRVLTESDGPFAKVTGKPIYPWDTNLAINRIAQIWKCSPEEGVKIVFRNFKQLLSAHSRYSCFDL